MPKYNIYIYVYILVYTSIVIQILNDSNNKYLNKIIAFYGTWNSLTAFFAPNKAFMLTRLNVGHYCYLMFW